VASVVAIFGKFGILLGQAIAVCGVNFLYGNLLAVMAASWRHAPIIFATGININIIELYSLSGESDGAARGVRQHRIGS
jgi:hypothetical protein